MHKYSMLTAQSSIYLLCVMEVCWVEPLIWMFGCTYEALESLQSCKEIYFVHCSFLKQTLWKLNLIFSYHVVYGWEQNFFECTKMKMVLKQWVGMLGLDW